MKQPRHNFTRLSIEEMKVKKALNEVANNLEDICLEEAEKLSQELLNQGYDMDSFELDLDYELKDDTVIVHLRVVQEAKTLQFNLKDLKKRY